MHFALIEAQKSQSFVRNFVSWSAQLNFEGIMFCTFYFYLFIIVYCWNWLTEWTNAKPHYSSSLAPVLAYFTKRLSQRWLCIILRFNLLSHWAASGCILKKLVLRWNVAKFHRNESVVEYFPQIVFTIYYSGGHLYYGMHIRVVSTGQFMIANYFCADMLTRWCFRSSVCSSSNTFSNVMRIHPARFRTACIRRCIDSGSFLCHTGVSKVLSQCLSFTHCLTKCSQP